MTETVTVRNPEICSAEFERAPEPTPSTGAHPETLKSEVTLGDRARDAWIASRAYWTPPEVLTKRPPAVSALYAYAKHAAWTRQIHGFIRRAGILFALFFGIPWTVACRYAEWIGQRFGRLITVLILTKLLAHTTPGRWLVGVGEFIVGVLAWALL